MTSFTPNFNDVKLNTNVNDVIQSSNTGGSFQRDLYRNVYAFKMARVCMYVYIMYACMFYICMYMHEYLS